MNEESLGAESYRLPLVTHCILTCTFKSFGYLGFKRQIDVFSFSLVSRVLPFLLDCLLPKEYIYDSGFYFSNNAVRFC